MEFLVEFQVKIPDGTPDSEVQHRERAEATAATKLVDEGHLVRVWKRRMATSESTIIGLYRANSEAQLDGVLAALPSTSRSVSQSPRSSPIPTTRHWP